ncbi:hypothetical protein L9F63_021589, partial [Diploptera punctata]
SKFDWDEKQQGVILASFFWCFWIMQVPGGILAQRYGTKLVYGFGNFIPCLLSFFIPFCARLDYRVLSILRGIQGFIAGVTWPSMHHLAVNWIPPNERSKFVTAYMGSSIGAAITYPLSGLLINQFDWPAVFHVTGIFGTIWFIAWWLLIYDSPAQHPRISEKEKSEIIKKLGESYTEKRLKIKTPWKKILLSRPMWMNILAQWGNIWGLFTLMTQAPTYFKLIHGWDIRMTGFLSGMPHLARVSFAILMSFIGDFLLRKSYMSRTNVRKLAAAWCCIGQGIFTLGLMFCGCNSIAAIIFSTIATGVSGSVSTGPLASFIDISPNYASIMLGISNMISVVPGFISPIIVGYLTYENQTVEAWKSVFLISTVMLIVPGVLYMFFSSSELQDWNTLGCMSVRDIMWYLVFTGFAMNYMFRLNINIGIVSMVKTRKSISKTALSNVCNQEILISNLDNTTNVTTTPIHDYDESRFDWDEKQQGVILASFFWCFWIMQVPGGVLAQRYGTKLVYGFSNFIPCLLSFFIPFCARLDYRVLSILRGIQGFIAGLTWPAMHHLAANWIPPNERSKFVTAYMGSSVGAAITYPLSGLLINWFDWPAVFHVTGIFGTIWFIAWWLLIYDSPAQHPRISEKEKSEIIKKLGESYTEKRLKIKTPWKKILLSRPMWMNILAQWGNIWGLFTLMTQAPTYFKLIHGWDIRMTGFLSGMPHLARVSFAILMSFIGDFLLRKSYMSRTNVRKWAAAWCCIGQGLFTLGLVFCGCNSIAAIIFSTIATGVSGSVSTGPLASFIDISPNYASIMLGISSMVSVVPGFISPIIVGHLTYENQTVEAWEAVFLISTIMLIVPGVLYTFFSSSELQDWNTSGDQKTHDLRTFSSMRLSVAARVLYIYLHTLVYVHSVLGHVSSCRDNHSAR